MTRDGNKATTGKSTLTRGSEEGQSPLKLFSADDTIDVLPAFSAYNGNKIKTVLRFVLLHTDTMS